MRANILTIGDEILIGQIVDTNTVFLAQQLNKIGYAIQQKISVGDNLLDIQEALLHISKEIDLIIITGGLGPTSDDVTKQALCNFFTDQLYIHDPTLRYLQERYTPMGQEHKISMLRQQASILTKSIVLPNKKGTAPGMLIQENNRTYIVLPGVPAEMKWIFTNEVIPFLQQKSMLLPFAHETILTVGKGESDIAHILSTFEQALPSSIKLAYLPQWNMVRLRLSMILHAEEDNAILLEQKKKLIASLNNIIVVDGDIAFEEHIISLLVKHHFSLSIAESCTGGALAKIFTQHAGASNYFKGGLVSYSTESKENILHIPSSLITMDGVISKEVALAMARAVRNLFQSHIGIATTGNVGPTSIDNKPMGEIWVAVVSDTKEVCEVLHVNGDRERNIYTTIVKALMLLYTHFIS